LPGVNIRYIDRLETSVEMLTKALRADSLIATMEYAVNKMNGLIDDQITSLQDLYEVGAISGSEYETKAASLDAQKVSLQQDLVDATVKQMNTIAELNAWIQTNMGAYLASQGVNATYGSEAASEIADKTGIKAETIAGASIGMALAGPLGAAIGIVIAPYVKDLIAKIPVVSDVVDFGSDVIGKGVDLVSDAVSYVGDKAKKFKKWLGFANGTPELPRDMIAQVHKGEGIVPATFMDGIRRGELSLSSGGNEGGGQTTNVYVTVQGSVQTENNLADSIANRINIRRSRGMLTV